MDIKSRTWTLRSQKTKPLTWLWRVLWSPWASPHPILKQSLCKQIHKLGPWEPHSLHIETTLAFSISVDAHRGTLETCGHLTCRVDISEAARRGIKNESTWATCHTKVGAILSKTKPVMTSRPTEQYTQREPYAALHKGQDMKRAVFSPTDNGYDRAVFYQTVKERMSIVKTLQWQMSMSSIREWYLLVWIARGNEHEHAEIDLWWIELQEETHHLTHGKRTNTVKVVKEVPLIVF